MERLGTTQVKSFRTMGTADPNDDSGNCSQAATQRVNPHSPGRITFGIVSDLLRN